MAGSGPAKIFYKIPGYIGYAEIPDHLEILFRGDTHRSQGDSKLIRENLKPVYYLHTVPEYMKISYHIS